jgi:leucyl aminopeptidase
MNTDAEGRLILADALCLAAERGPTRIIDLATLTGSCMVALGSKVAGLFANDDETAEVVRAAASGVGERVWRMPMDGDYRESLKSPVADLKNVGSKWGGAIIAAKFLEEFVGGRPWAHLDIAGPAWADSDSPGQDAGATGCFVRTLVRLAEEAGGR